MSMTLDTSAMHNSWIRLGPTMTIAVAIIAVLAFISLFAPWLTPYDPDLADVTQKLLPPSGGHWLGTDHLGRDVMTRLLHGTRVSLGTVGLCLALILVMGIGIGGLSGYVGGRVDQVIMRCCDVFLTFPTTVLALFMVGMLGTGLVNVILAIALSHWAWYARIVRGLVLSLRERDYVLAARACGASRLRIFFEHLLPTIFAQLVVLATLDIGHMMLHVSALSFLGLGVAPPTAEWGVMIKDAQSYIWNAPQLVVFPGIAILISVMAFNLLGDGLRDRLDPSLHAEHGH